MTTNAKAKAIKNFFECEIELLKVEIELNKEFSKWASFAVHGHYQDAYNYIDPMPPCAIKTLIIEAIKDMENIVKH